MPGGGSIQVVGLGPGDWSQLTVGVLEQLLAARSVYFRTFVHPVVEPLRRRLRPEARVVSFDEHYERALSFDGLYDDIVQSLLAAAAESPEPIVYAVPGHPLVGERTVTLLRASAPARGVAVTIWDGLSFVEAVATLLGVDPLGASLTLLDGASLLDTREGAGGGPAATTDAPGGTEIAAVPSDGSPANLWCGISPRLHSAGRPLLIGQVYDRRVASAAKLWLMERYPPDHQVTVVAAAGTSEARSRVTPLLELDHSAAFDHLTSVYVPPLEPLSDVRSLASLPYLVARLRAPDGCPWDRKQTIGSLAPNLLEETHELVDALDRSDLDGALEELGDLLLLITMIAQVGEESGDFDLPTVLEAVSGKLLRRHPHVFGDTTAATAEAVVQNWERLKANERTQSTSALSGVPVAMPSLLASQVMQRKAAALGFDWPDISGVYAKVEEELREVREAASDTTLEEAGDLLFAMVSLCRHLAVDADEALRKANAKFRRRFETVEALCRRQGVHLAALDPTQLDALWEKAKELETRS